MERKKITYTTEQDSAIQKEFNLLIRNCKHCPKTDVREVERAYKLARDAHEGQNRKTGEPFVLHPISVSRIVSEEMRLDREAIVAALLHDVVEDTSYTTEDISAMFGNDIADIVEGLTKIERVYKENPNIERTNIQAENFVKLLDTIALNIRVIYIKIADRLHNMRTLEGMPTNKQLEKAGEVLFVYAPLAHRLGLHDMKNELEDLSFKFRQPEAYEDLKQQIEAREVWHDAIMDPIASRMREIFRSEHIDVRVKKRKRSYYSTWKRMNNYHVTLDELENFLNIRLVFPNKQDVKHDALTCWSIYGILTLYFTTTINRVKDWLSSPRSNGYSALHAAVLSENKWIDVEIVSERMQAIADRGYGTLSQHFNPENERTLLDHWLSHVQSFLNDEETRDKTEILDILKDNLYISDILVYTPKGESMRLPRESTVLDFAFHIHTELGKKCIGANVNHRLQDRAYILNNGDTVEIITSEAQKPEPYWYNEVSSALAKSKLKRVFREEHIDRIQNGERIFKDILSEHNIKVDEQVIDKLEEKFEFLFKAHFYYKVDKGYITREDIENAFVKKSNKQNTQWGGKGWFNFLPFSNSNANQTVKINPKKEQKLDNDFNTGQVVLKNCCHPIPGDEASGYLDNLGHIIVHRNDCNVLMRLIGNSDKRIFKVDWDKHKSKSFVSRVEIKGIDRVRLIKDMIKVISDNFGMYIQAVNITSEGSVFSGTLDVRVHGVDELTRVVKKLKSIGGMEDVNRVINF